MSQKSYFKFIDETIENTQKAFSGVIQRFVSLVSGATAGDPTRFLDATIAEDTARALLGEAGYNDAVFGFIDNSYNAAVNQTARFLVGEVGGTFRFSDESLAIVESIRETDLLQFNQISNDLSNRIGTAFSDWARGGVSRTDFINQVSQQSEIINERYLKTQVDTAFSAYNRTVNEKMATDAGFTQFKYIGPDDKKTRDFCDKVLGEVKTLEEWNELNDDPDREGQPSPVSSFGGGWSCRHTLVPVE